ncbi:MAG: fructose-1,6-bisphosphatase [Lachnospiraceae bacterium]|nr:fructose-1,6-bisphosphatase [Lachnospiraceae bacterium]
MRELDYLKLLSRQFPNQEKTCVEIANLSSILTLPKGTEFFLSDLHGEHEAFIHLLRSASGVIRSKIKFIFKEEMTDEEILEFANIIYYPEEQLDPIDFRKKETYDFQKVTIMRLIKVVKDIASKYSKSKVRKSLKQEYVYLLDELLYKDTDRDNVKKEFYYEEIINSIIEIGLSKTFIIEMCKLIQKLAVDTLHIVGDIFDRGPRHDLILDELIDFHNVDIEWGNHDIEWMGASLGNETLILNALRIAVRYNCYDMLEDGYGISLRALNDFAARTYMNDPCEIFMPKILDENKYDVVRPSLSAKIQKALAIMQFKVEGKLIKKHPEYGMTDRVMLERIDYNDFTIDIKGQKYKLLDTSFPTIDVNDPLKLSEEEEVLLKSLKASFIHSRKLKEHIKFLYDKGSLYKIHNGNLIYHGIIPFDKDGKYAVFKGFDGKQNLSGKELLDYFEKIIRNANSDVKMHNFDSDNVDAMFYMWCGSMSPLFGKDTIKTFELYFVGEKETQVENKNEYYKLYQDEKTVIKILNSFGLSESGHIINGHVPVKVLKGESPVKANGRLFIIDGGMSKSYQKSTGIAGYTLISDSVHLTIATHKPFDKEKFDTPEIKEVENIAKNGRIRIKDTDRGKVIMEKIADLKELLVAYRNGLIKEE